MLTTKSLVAITLVVTSVAGTALAAPSTKSPAADKHSSRKATRATKPLLVEESFAFADGTPAARADARAIEVSEHRIASDNLALRATVARERRDKQALALDEQRVARSKIAWDRAVNGDHPVAAGLEAVRHHQAVVEREQARTDLSAARTRQRQLEQDRTIAIKALGAEQVRGERQLIDDLGVFERVF